MIINVERKGFIMKKLLFIAIMTVGSAMCAKSQETVELKDDIKIIFENDQLKVTEYDSNPGKDACGAGEHSHNAHLTVVLTDMKAKVTMKNGQTQDAELKAGTSFWSEAETHSVINTGNQPAKVLLIEPKEQVKMVD